MNYVRIYANQYPTHETWVSKRTMTIITKKVKMQESQDSNPCEDDNGYSEYKYDFQNYKSK